MASVPSVTLIKGDFATGKTTGLINRVLELVGGGASPADILVFTASPAAADDMAHRLAEAAKACPETVQKAAAKVRVCTPRAYFLEALAAPAAQEATGRDARLLNSFEYDFFIEDLKTSTIPPKRLGEMMKFFNRQFTELRDFEEGWLYTVEEQELYDLMQDCLGFCRGIAVNECAGLFVRAAQAGATAKVPYVLVDDFRCLSRGSQVAATLIASRELVVTDDPAGPLKIFEDYPYAEGLDELEEENPDMQVVCLGESHCSRAGYAAAGAFLKAAAIPTLTAEELNKADWDETAALAAKNLPEVVLPAFAGAGEAAVERLRFETPQKEYRGMAAKVAALLEEGYAPGDILVATPHRTWQRNMAIALDKKGIHTSELASGKVFAGDIRDFAYCDAHQVLTALQLLANPSDGVAWRSWLGFGDWLTNSNGLKQLRDRAAITGTAIDGAIEMLPAMAQHIDVGEGRESCERMNAAVERCKTLFERCAGLCGEELLKAVTATVLGEDAKVPPVIETLVAPVTAKNQSRLTPEVFVSQAAKRLQFPTCSPEEVRLVPYDSLFGLSAKVLIIVGFVNGFVPKHDFFDRTQLIADKRETRRVEDLKRAARVFSSATERILISTFALVDMEVADRSHIVMDRIGLVDGKPMSYTQPSIMLEKL